jgi:nucleoid-associated protein YgaU
VWVVVEGQTLDWIAYQEYGSAAHWRHIADTNDLDDPRQLRSGQILNLVPLP